MALGQKWHCPHCRRGSPRYGRGSHCDGPNGGAAAQTRMVSVAEIRLDLRESTRLFKGIICVDISEFESYMPSHAVWSLGDCVNPSLADLEGDKARIQLDSRGECRPQGPPRLCSSPRSLAHGLKICLLTTRDLFGTATRGHIGKIVAAERERESAVCQRWRPARRILKIRASLSWVSPGQASLPRSWPTLELCTPNAAPQTRIVSKTRNRLDSWKVYELSKAYLATTFLSSNLTCPATQSRPCGAPWGVMLFSPCL
jgi:hypothetical protein